MAQGHSVEQCEINPLCHLPIVTASTICCSIIQLHPTFLVGKEETLKLILRVLKEVSQIEKTTVKLVFKIINCSDKKMLIINSRYGRYVFNIEFGLLSVAGTIDSND